MSVSTVVGMKCITRLFFLDPKAWGYVVGNRQNQAFHEKPRHFAKSLDFSNCLGSSENRIRIHNCILPHNFSCLEFNFTHLAFPWWVKEGQAGGLGRVGLLGHFPKTWFLAISDYSKHFSKLGLGRVRVGQVGWAGGSFFKNLISRHFRQFWTFFKK